MFDDQSKEEGEKKLPEDIFAPVDNAPNPTNSAPPAQNQQQENTASIAQGEEDLSLNIAKEEPAPDMANIPSVPNVEKNASSMLDGSSGAFPSIPEKKSHSILKLSIIVIVSVIIVFAALILVYLRFMEADTSDSNQDSSQEEIINQQVQEEEKEEDIPDIDSDGDGLMDKEESTYGTDPKDFDSDNDGLGDREEVKVYFTDPLDSDSDDDGYLDGTEVAQGYDPNGDGKLFDIPK